MNTELEKQLIDHVAGTKFEDLDPETIACCKNLVMDSLGVTIPGISAPGCGELRELMSGWQTPQGASILFTNLRVAPPYAALVNSAMMHALDFDDTLDASALHTFVNVLPAALAAAEARGNVSGKELITALVLGVDVICRISLGIERPLSWIRTATCGSFGNAVAAGKILCRDREQLANALGVVYGQTSGNAQGLIEGRLVKRMQPGFAAAAGVLAANLAARGVTGSREFLTGTYGYYSLYERGEYDPEPVTRDLGRRFLIRDLSIKPYPSCRMTHSSIDAALRLKDRLPSVNAVESIEVTASSMVAEMVGKPFRMGDNPQVDAQFSIPYTVACALARGDVFLGDFELQQIADPVVMNLSQRVRATADPALAPKDILHAEVALRLKDGRVLTERTDAPLGNPLNPLSTDQCRDKFLKCLRHSDLDIKEGTVLEVLAMIEDLELVPNVRELIGKLTA